MDDFVYEALPTRVVFGAGCFDSLETEAARLGSRFLILSTPGQAALADRAREMLGRIAVGCHSRAVMHVPKAVVDAAHAEVDRLDVDGLVAIGGGSTTGLAKAIALRTGLPILAVPTTYAGSEMTPIWGITEDRLKRTGRDPIVLPRTALYDPLLTLSLPPEISGPSGLNAIAHCVEGLYSETRNPLVSIMAEQGIEALARALPILRDDPKNLTARRDALYGAWLGGTVLGSVGMALHHKLCHVLGGSFDLPHAAAHAIVLPHVASYNAAAAPEAMRRVARALGTDDAPLGLYQLLVSVSAKTSLAEIGLPNHSIDQVVELALANPYFNPAPLERARLRTLVADAWSARPPTPAAPFDRRRA